jgi:putative membrane fusion protein
MKRGTKILLIVFIVVAAGLYIYLEAVPKIEGMSENTVVIEYGDLPVSDKAEVLIVRDETLFGSKKNGAVTYEQDEGTKVREGVRVVAVEGGGTVAAATDAAISSIREIAGDALKMTGSFKADRTAVVSYYADGYEARLSAENVGAITDEDMESCPAKGAPLKAAHVAKGDPIYKLTNNNEWYMIYWTKTEDDTGRYVSGAAVTVSLGGSKVDAEVHSATPDGEKLKVVLYSDMYYKDLARVRKADAEIVFAEYKGLIADRQNIATRSGAPGVFVKQRAGGYKWTPVNILKEAGGKCVLSVDVYYDKEGKPIDTVNYYDEVLADPEAEGYE